MSYVGIVGSRQGADLDHVRAFVAELHGKYPDTILVSGGAVGVDDTAEQEWLARGGRVVSFRVTQTGLEEYAIQTWELGGPQPRFFIDESEPTFKTYASALTYRDILIAEKSERVVAFYKPGRSRGAGFTIEIAREAYERPVYEFEAASAA